MNKKNLLPLEKKVLSLLADSGVSVLVSEKSPLGIAVSGGADSVSLLLSLRSIFDSKLLRVVTVNHGIRAEDESGGDALFVKNLCEKLGVFCKVFEIPHGKIAEKAKKNGESVEALARRERYGAFEAFIESENLCFLALAHNQNDQTETLLMRFLQGSGLEGSGGISFLRGKFVRPLLCVSRSEIESYLREKNQGWREDSTNSDTKYLRNRIRKNLIPFLNENFSGWEKAVVSGGKKSGADEDFFKGEVLKLLSENRNSYSVSSSAEKNKKIARISRKFFYNLHDSLKRRVFFHFLNEIGFGSRFPYHLFEEASSWNGKSREICFEGVKISLSGENLEIAVSEKKENSQSQSGGGFSFLLKKIGESAKIGSLSVKLEKNEESGKIRKNGGKPCAKLSFRSEKGVEAEFFVNIPVIVRNSVYGDKIKSKDGKLKSVSEIFSDQKIPPDLREKVPVVEEIFPEMELRAVVASPFGAKNWIVETQKLL